MSDSDTGPSGLSPEQVAGLGDELVLIDVRRPYEWEGGRIEGARNIEMNELTREAESISRELTVVFYCRRGNRSAMAAQAFREAGYDAHHLSGGIAAWVEDGRPLEPEHGEVRAPLPAS